MKFIIFIVVFLNFIPLANSGILDSLFGRQHHVSGCLYNEYGEKVDCWRGYYKDHTDLKKYERWCLDDLWKTARSLGGGLEEDWTIDGCLSSEGPY